MGFLARDLTDLFSIKYYGLEEVSVSVTKFFIMTLLTWSMMGIEVTVRGQQSVNCFTSISTHMTIDDPVLVTYQLPLPDSDSKSDPVRSNETTRTRLKPNCTIETSLMEGKDFQCVQVKPNQFRIIGEYGVLTINCSAQYLLNLVYDGFRPTEAVKILYWKDVQVDVNEEGEYTNRSIQLYGMTVTITSNQKLYEDYQTNIKSYIGPNRREILNPIIYSRTARFNIQEMYKDEFDSLLSFYFFFEEPLMADKPTLMWNQYTEYEYEKIINDKLTLIIPCRISHYEIVGSTQILIMKHGGEKIDMTSLVTYDPSVGFQVTVTDHPQINWKNVGFECRISFPNKTLMWRATSTNDTPRVDFGLNQLKMTKDTDSLKLFVVDNQNKSSQYSSLRCLLNTEPSKDAKFLSWGQPLTSFTQLNLSREFVLPIFSHLSYTVQSGIQPYANSFSFNVTRESTYGVLFCTTGRQYKYIEFATAVNGQIFEFPAGINWLPMNPQAPSSTYLKIRLDEPAISQLMYTRDPFIFVCRHVPHAVIRPVLWFTKNKNGTTRLVYKDALYKDDFPRLFVNLTSDVVQVSCSMSFYDSHHWATSFIDLNLADGNEPKVTNMWFNFKFVLGSNQQIIKCQASGQPIPTVWWMRHDQVLNETIGQGSATLEIDTVTQDVLGEYVCTFKNIYGQGNRSFWVNTPQVTVNSTQEGQSVVTSDEGFPIYWVVAGLVVLFILSTGVIYFYFRTRFLKEILSAQEIREFENGVTPSDNEYAQPLAQAYPKEYEIPKSQFTVDYDSVLGSGAFGLVTKGSVRNVPVAVKTVKTPDKNSIKALLSEIKILIYLGESPYLIHLIGASTVQLRQGIVFAFVEFCDLGSLLTFLQKNRYEFMDGQKSYANMESNKDLNVNLLTKWAWEIAQGLLYLASKKVIHGDLAARNILLTKNRQVKITDFGLSRQLYAYSMYVKQSQEPLPWRWLAIESLSDLTFTIESDIWSYGVLIWEIFSLGEVPYPGLSWNPEFVNLLKSGTRMGCPAQMSQNLFRELVLPCWEMMPERRPKFDSIIRILESHLEAAAALEEPHYENPSLPMGPL